MKCRHCGYEWPNRTSNPKECPRCKGRLNRTNCVFTNPLKLERRPKLKRNLGWKIPRHITRNIALTESSKASVRQVLVYSLVVMLMAPALALIMTTRGGVVEATPDTFGYETPGGSNDLIEYTMRGSVFTCPSAGTADNITVYIVNAADGEIYQAAIYKHSDNSKVGETATRTDISSDGWWTFSFGSPPSLSASTDYVLVAWSEMTTEIAYNAGDTDQGHYQDDGLTEFPVTATFVHEDKKYSIYCNYTPTPTPPTKPILYLPADGSTLPALEDTPYFEWTEGENATSHRLLVDNDSDFSSPEENRVLTDNFYTIADENSLPEDNYSWKVGATNEGFENWSATWTFVVTNWATPISVEYVSGQSEGNESIYTIDNDTTTYWYYSSEATHEIWFKMAESYLINKIRLYQGSTGVWGGSSGLIVYVSDNTQNWGDNVWEGVLNSSNQWNETSEFNANGQYTRLVSKTDIYTQRMYEFDAYLGREWHLIETWTGTVEAPIEWQMIETWTGTVNVPPSSTVTTENATNIGDENATFNATVEYGLGRDNVDIRFRYKSDRYCYAEADNENWTLGDHHYYGAPEDPATLENWATDRTPVIKIAASNSLQSAKDNADFVCDGDNDHIEINNAIENLRENYGEGTVFLYDGTYYFHDSGVIFSISQYEVTENISLIGQSREGTIFRELQVDEDIHAKPLGFRDNARNILIENITLSGVGRTAVGEFNLTHITSRISNIVFNNVIFENIPTIGLYFEDSNSENIWIENSIFRNTGHGGLVVALHDGDYHRNFYVQDTVFTHNGLGSPSYEPTRGAYFLGVENLVFANNIVENSGHSGILITQSEGFESKDVLIQGNRFRNNGLMSASAPAIQIAGFSGSITENIRVIGNDIDQGYGISITQWTENCLFENNNFYNTVVDFENYLGSNHTRENNVSPYYPSNYYTSFETISENYSKVVDNLYGTNYYGRRMVGFRAEIKFNSSENYGDILVFSSLTSTKPELTSPENNTIIWDNTPTFIWYSYGTPGNSNLKVDNDNDFSSLEVNATIYWAGGTSTYTAGELQYDNYYWKIIDDYGGGSTENSGTAIFELMSPLPTIENLYITDADNIAIDNLIPQTEYRFHIEVADNETLADIENVTLVIYLDNENLPDAVENHYTFRWTRDGGFEEVGPDGTLADGGASTVGTDTHREGISNPNQRKSFKAAGRYWEFYSDGTDMVYRTSTDGSTWSEATTVRSSTRGYDFSVEFDETYIHYALTLSQGAYYGEHLYYRRGLPNADGTITWSAPEQTVLDAFAYASYYRRSTNVQDNLWATDNSSGTENYSTEIVTGTTSSGNYFYINPFETLTSPDGESLPTEITMKGWLTENVNLTYEPPDCRFRITGSLQNRAAYSHAGRLYMRLWKSPNADMSDAVPISDWEYYSISFSATIEENKTLDARIPVTPENAPDNEYLYVEFVWRITTAATDASAGFYLRANASGDLVQRAHREYRYPTITIDSNGYPFIACYCHEESGPSCYYQIHVTKSSLDNGTWQTDSGFPCVVCGNVSRVSLVPLTGGKVYFVYIGSTGLLKGRLWDGATMGDEESVATSKLAYLSFKYQPFFSVVSEGDNVHVVFENKSNSIVYLKRTYGVGWSSENVVQASVADRSSPVLSIRDSELYCFWIGSPTAGHVYYKKYVGGTWDSEPTDWIDETADNFYQNDFLTSFYEDYGGKIGVSYVTETSSPYKLRFAYLYEVPTHLITDNCVAGDNTKTIDNFIFAIEFGEDAQVTDSDNWDVWIQVYDSAGNEDNRFFLNQFDIVSAAEWNLLETWTGAIEAPVAWQEIENWTGTVETPVAWNLIESWDGIIGVRAPAEWQLVETWSGAAQAPSAWQLIEIWDGTVETPAQWSSIEEWSGTLQAPTAWILIESWDGTVQASAAWDLIETWDGTIEVPTEWNLVETWDGTVSAPVGWNLIEEWSGTIEAFSGWQLLETWTGTVEAFAEWQLVETWGGTIRTPTVPVWNLVETWTGTIEAPAEWVLIETWTGTVQAPTAWNLIESWGGTITAPSAWNLIESWTGTVQAPTAWQLIETWTGAISAPAQWDLLETWDGIIESPVVWQLVESWNGTIIAPTAWQLIETWAGAIQTPSAWDLMESWSGTILAPSEWSEVESWTGTVYAVGWRLIETWGGTVQTETIAAWNLIESWDGTVRTLAVYAVSVSITPDNQSGTLGTTLTYTIVVVNIGGLADNYDLTSSDPQGWPVYFDDSTILNVASGASENTTLNVGLSTLGTHTITVTATSQGDSSIDDTASCTAISAAAGTIVGGGDASLALAVAMLALGLVFSLPFVLLIRRRRGERREGEVTARI